MNDEVISNPSEIKKILHEIPIVGALLDPLPELELVRSFQRNGKIHLISGKKSDGSSNDISP
jgi:hypothetical protein